MPKLNGCNRRRQAAPIVLQERRRRRRSGFIRSMPGCPADSGREVLLLQLCYLRFRFNLISYKWKKFNQETG